MSALSLAMCSPTVNLGAVYPRVHLQATRAMKARHPAGILLSAAIHPAQKQPATLHSIARHAMASMHASAHAQHTMNLQAITRCSQVLHACLTCDA